MKKYAKVTIKAAAVRAKERSIFQQMCPWWRRRRTYALKDGRGLHRRGDDRSKAEAPGLRKRGRERAEGPQEKRVLPSRVSTAGSREVRVHKQIRAEPDWASPESQGLNFDIHSIHKHLLNTFCAPGTADYAGDADEETRGKSDARIPCVVVSVAGQVCSRRPGNHGGRPV